MKGSSLIRAIPALSLCFSAAAGTVVIPPGQQTHVRPSVIPAPLLSETLLDVLIDEVSGETQLNNERLLASFNHSRTASEYQTVFYESACLLQKLKDYGVGEAGIEDVPVVLAGGKSWDAESAELWMVEPEKKKLTSLEDVPACLCEESRSSDITAELVYAGPGNKERDYEGKDVKDKIVLVTSRAYEAFDLAVGKKGAKGIIVYNSSHPDHDPDQVGWDTIARAYDPEKDKGTQLTFGFMVSTRMGEELRRSLDEGRKIILQAKCRTAYYPKRNEVVWALIKGNEKPEEELLFTAHLYEGMAKQGANDNASGCVSLLETARVITKLIREGRIAPLKRSIRFLWIDEHVGTLGYIKKYPHLVKRWFANINEDMVGEGLIKNLASFHMKSTAHSLPSFLNDVVANFIEYVGETNRDNVIHRPAKFIKPIISAAGSRDPFYYHIEKFTGGSDHTIFMDAGLGIPGIQLIVWPDMWYHTNLDRPDKSDSTQLKRVSVIDTASAIYLASASKTEAFRLLGEVFSCGSSRIGEEERRSFALLSQSTPATIQENYKEALNLVHQVYAREEKTLKSVAFFAGSDPAFHAYLEKACSHMKKKEELSLETINNQYQALASSVGVKAIEPTMSAEEKRLSRLVPIRTKIMRGFFDRKAFAERIKGEKLPAYDLRSSEDYEIRNFIDGRRSILEIRNAVSAEFRPIPLSDVENYCKALEAGGMITIENK